MPEQDRQSIILCYLACSILCLGPSLGKPQCCPTQQTCSAPPTAAPCDLCKTGCQQSPINILSSAACDIDLPPLRFINHWAADICLTMAIAGDTVLIKPPKECQMSLDGGPLSGSYILDQLHFHWGETDNNGTEHCIDGLKSSMEAHLVYYNCFYGCISSAIGQPDGIAIVAVILESKPTFHNCNLDPVVSNLCKLKCPGASATLKKNVLKMFKDSMESQEYYTYEGSLTTPPCCEQVLWLVFKNYVCVHCSQVAAFRNLVNECGKPICRNWRKTQPLNGRTVYNARASTCGSSCGK